jgi:hypothetical protein
MFADGPLITVANSRLDLKSSVTAQGKRPRAIICGGESSGLASRF